MAVETEVKFVKSEIIEVKSTLGNIQKDIKFYFDSKLDKKEFQEYVKSKKEKSKNTSKWIQWIPTAIMAILAIAMYFK